MARVKTELAVVVANTGPADSRSFRDRLIALEIQVQELVRLQAEGDKRRW